MELLLFTALGFIAGVVLRAGREEEARQEGIVIGRRQGRLDYTEEALAVGRQVIAENRAVLDRLAQEERIAELKLAIKRAYNVWRVYEINTGCDIDGCDGMRWTHVVRDDGGQPLAFPTEDAARAYIESVPDATEADYPA